MKRIFVVLLLFVILHLRAMQNQQGRPDMNAGSQTYSDASDELFKRSLRAAIKNGDIQSARMLLAGIGPCCTLSEVRLAAEQQSETFVLLILDHVPGQLLSRPMIPSDIQTLEWLLYRTIAESWLIVLQSLVSRKVQLIFPKFQKTLAFSAVHANNPEILKVLLDAELNLVFQDWNGYLPLHEAAEFGRYEAVRMLIERYYVPVDSVDRVRGRTPLHYAVKEGNFDIVKYLLEHGANKYIQDKEGKSVFDLAQGQPRIINLLYTTEVITEELELQLPMPSASPPDEAPTASGIVDAPLEAEPFERDLLESSFLYPHENNADVSSNVMLDIE